MGISPRRSFGDGHGAGADKMQRVRLVPFGEDELPGLVLIELRRRGNGPKHVQGHPGREAGLDGAQDKGFVEHPRAASTEFSSLFMVRRVFSMRTRPLPARTVAERRRPDSRLISPKKFPCPEAMVSPRATSICTSPSRTV